MKDTSTQSLHFHTGILNQMTCTASNTRMDFANRLVAQFLVVMSLNGEMSEAGRCERLLNGLKANPKYRMGMKDAKENGVIEEYPVMYSKDKLPVFYKKFTVLVQKSRTIMLNYK